MEELMALTKLGLPLEAGIANTELSAVQESPKKRKYRVVRLSANSASIVPLEGKDPLTVIVTDQSAGQTAVTINWGEILDTITDGVNSAAKFIAGKCDKKIEQTVEYNDDGIVTGSKTTVTIDCD
jgi:hypothetical protein